MSLVPQLALVSETPIVDFSWLAQVSAALQKQVMRDFAPIWEIQATVDAFARLEDIPIGYWPIIVLEDIQGAAGAHLDINGQPIALVEYGLSWSLSASHECLEMLADPFGNRMVAGTSPMEDQGRVEFLVEICDPCGAPFYAYTVNGILVSDFYTPNYFEPEKVAGARYSFSGAVTKPREVLADGYLSWRDPVTGHWWLQTFFGPGPSSFFDLGILRLKSESLREVIDSKTLLTRRLSHLKKETPALAAAVDAYTRAERSSVSKAEAWREQIDELKRTVRSIDNGK